MAVPGQQDKTTVVPEGVAQATASGEHGERSQPEQAGQIRSTGAIPPVASGGDGTPSTPSASDRAFGNPQLNKPTRDAEGARANIPNPTWDPNVEVAVGDKKEKGGWVDASTKSGGDDDKRMVKGTTLEPDKASSKLASGALTHDELGTLTTDQVAQVNPLGSAPRNILKHALHESWHTAKHALLAPGPNQEARSMLMAKLWEFRQWHHQKILRQTQAEVGADGLTEWKAAGSTTLTSDIDVNLKGPRTEEAVGVFNRLFKQDGWQHEAGVVYDVNVYAVDFMHKDTFKGLAEKRKGAPGEEHAEIERHDFGQDASPTRVSAKEGSRTGTVGGGVSQHNEMLAERMLVADANLQRVWSLVKMRLYMTGDQWQTYVTDARVPADVQSQVALRYDLYMKDLGDKMYKAANLKREADQLTKSRTGFQVLDAHAQAVGKSTGQDGENVKMAASNRLYEQRLDQMAEQRAKTEVLIARREQWINQKKDPADIDALDSAIDGNLAALRDLISECAMFSNEAYVTDGAVNHAVVGLQSKIGISQTRSESMDAFNENVGDSLKEIARHSGSLGEAAYKAGKYLWRLADAARNLGVQELNVDLLYQAGNYIANSIKGGKDSQEALENKSAEALQKALPQLSTPDALMGHIRALAAVVADRYSKTVTTASDSLGRASAVKHS